MNRKTGAHKKFWRFLADFWAIATIALFIFEIFIMKKSDTIANLASMVYIAILSIYAGQKEFYRWRQQHYLSLHWGEMFVVYWTGLMLITFAFSIWNGLRLPEGLAATYVAVITIFALTKKSKSLYYKKKLRK
ncbi:MAG: hypothetical protein WC596_04785 [Candidatus Shapirobacteria bacterium]